METMINYIHSIFKQFNYQNIGEEQDLIFMKHNLFHDYWILHTTTQFDLNSQLTIADKAQKAFEGIKEAEKNTTLLILWEVDKKDNSVLNRIIEIENDQFYFKKYVLLYSKNDWDDCKAMNIDDIQKILMDKKTFEKLKNEICGNDIGKYHLLYAIAHKLPFLMIDVTHTDDSLYSNKYIPSNEQEREIYDWAISINIDDMEDYINKEVEYNG